MLAEIAAHDPRAAALAEEVFRRRRDDGGDVADWIEQIEKARLTSWASGWRRPSRSLSQRCRPRLGRRGRALFRKDLVVVLGNK